MAQLKGEEEYWKFHPKKHPKHFQRKKNKNELISIDAEERVDNTSDLEGKRSFTTIKK